VRDDAFSIWLDAPPQLSIGQSYRLTPKGWTLSDAYGFYRPASHIKLTCKYLGFQAIRFKLHDRIKQRPISFQSVIPETAQSNKRLCASRRSVKLCPTSNKHPRSMQRDNFRSHTGSMNQRIQISQGLLIDVPNYHTFYTRSTAYKKQGAPDRWSLIQQKFMLFICVTPRTKSKGLLIDGPLLSKNLCFLHV
jgi:hypothetical protein